MYMLKKGIYRGGKVYYQEPIVNALTNGSWETGWSGVKSFGGKKSCYINNLDWWPESNQEVEFILEGNYAYIKSLGKVLSPEEADRYCRSF